MNLSDRISAFSVLGNELKNFINQVNASEVEEKYLGLASAVEQSFYHNGWFTKVEVMRAIGGISSFLKDSELKSWVGNHQETFNNSSEKSIGIVMAGNIPLVGFHDFLSVLISGFDAQIKMAGDDKLLLPAILDLLEKDFPELKNHVKFVDRLVDFDAVIATGSNNTSRYFESYFSKVPNIIRKNRTSIAVLNGEESKEDLELLGSDIFHFYGLGCRNVSKVYIPEEFNTDKLFEALLPYQHVMESKKYMNNYMYHQTLFLMNNDNILDNGFVVFKEDEKLHSPLGVLFIERYSDIRKLEVQLTKLKDQIQCIVGKGYLAFGNAQCPRLIDYADDVNTLNFLAHLNRN